jgi:hypothetical protein
MATTEINDADKVQLLFKEFTGVVNAKQNDPFPLESFAFKDYILNNNILSDDIPSTLPSGWKSIDLDSSSNITNNSVTNLASIGYPQLSFHKKRTLTRATFGSVKTWYIDDNSGGSVLKNAISFKTDPINNSYNYSVYQTIITNQTYSPVNMYTSPTFWLFDFKSGFLEFYGDDDNLNGGSGSGAIDLDTYNPVISFFQYVGSTGGSGSGGDASYNNIEVQGNNLMQSVTIQPWEVEPQPQQQVGQPPPPVQSQDYVIATIDYSGNVSNALGLFTIQLGEPYLQNTVFYAGAMDSKQPFIKILSNTNQDVMLEIGFSDLKIIDYNGVFYLTTTFIPGSSLEPAILKIILINNNANKGTPSSRDWVLRSDPDTDWHKDGPQPPLPTKMPWNTGPGSSLPSALITVSLLKNDGKPYGVSTQPEYFQNNIVLDNSANISAGDGSGTIDICGGLYVDRDASFNMSVYIRSELTVSNYIYSGGYRALPDVTDTSLILDASYNDTCSFNLRHQRGDISIGKKADETGWTIQSVDGIHMFTDTNMNPISVIENALDMGGNDIINLNTLTVQDISVNELSGNRIFAKGSLLLDYSSVEIDPQITLNWYDIIAVGNDDFVNPNIPKLAFTSASATVEIYILDYKTSGASFVDFFSYLKCEVSLFRAQAASIEVVSAFNILGTKQLIKGLRVKYRQNSISSMEPGGLFQIGLQDDFHTNNNDVPTFTLFCRVSDNNTIDYRDYTFSFNTIRYLNSTWRPVLSSSSNNNPDFMYSGSHYSYTNTHTVNLDFNPNPGTASASYPNGDGKLMYLNDKNCKFQSQVKFTDTVTTTSVLDICGNVNIRNNLNMQGTNIINTGNVTVRGNGSVGTYRTMVDFLDVSKNLIVDGSSSFNSKTNMYTDTSDNITTNLTTTGDLGFDTSNKIWTYNEPSGNFILSTTFQYDFLCGDLPTTDISASNNYLYFVRANSSYDSWVYPEFNGKIISTRLQLPVMDRGNNWTNNVNIQIIVEMATRAAGSTVTEDIIINTLTIPIGNGNYSPYGGFSFVGYCNINFNKFNNTVPEGNAYRFKINIQNNAGETYKFVGQNADIFLKTIEYIPQLP